MKRRPVPATYVVFTTSRRPHHVRDDLSRTMKVLDFGEGTVEDPSACWFEVLRLKDFPTVGSFMEALTKEEVLRVIQPISEGEGQDLARQIPLLATGEKGVVWTNGVICGQPSLSDESLRLLKKGIEDTKAGRVSQMPLFDEM